MSNVKLCVRVVLKFLYNTKTILALCVLLNLMTYLVVSEASYVCDPILTSQVEHIWQDYQTIFDIRERRSVQPEKKEKKKPE